VKERERETDRVKEREREGLSFCLILNFFYQLKFVFYRHKTLGKKSLHKIHAKNELIQNPKQIISGNAVRCILKLKL
jgi:hypothetical protein